MRQLLRGVVLHADSPHIGHLSCPGKLWSKGPRVQRCRTRAKNEAILTSYAWPVADREHWHREAVSLGLATQSGPGDGRTSSPKPMSYTIPGDQQDFHR